MGGGLIFFLIKQFQLFGLDALLPGPMGSISYGLAAAIFFFIVVSLLTSNEKIRDMQEEYDAILGTAAAERGCRSQPGGLETQRRTHGNAT